jgi:hypothetical protein
MSDQWTADTYPAVPPNEKFRQELQLALEQTHRQQIAQRKLGTRGAHRSTRKPNPIFGLLVILALLVLAVRWWRRRTG